MHSPSTWPARALAGFTIGFAVCLMYWSFGFIPRETWLSSPIANSMVQAKGWIWPTALLDVVFRDVGSGASVAILYALNGLMYAVISVGSSMLRLRPVLYVSFLGAVLGLLSWFNISVLQTFSWLGFFVVLMGLILLAILDLCSPMKSKGGR
jgi:hypothetical protein